MQRNAAAADTAAILLALIAGCIAAAQVGKVPPAIEAIRAELSMSLVQIAWVASAISAATAALGIAVALTMARRGAHTGLLNGLILLTLGSVGGAEASSGNLLLVSRILEGTGFVLVVVSAPSLIASTLAHTPQRRRLWLTLWSCYMPVGIALTMGLAPLILEAGGWRSLWWWNAGLLAVCSAVAFSYRNRLRDATRAAAGPTAPPPSWRALRQPGSWLMGISFGAFAAIWFVIATWLPSFAVEYMGYTARGATWLTALAVVGNIAGNLGAGFLAAAGLPRWAVIAGVQVMLGALGWLVFSADADPLLRSLAAIVACAGAGALPATVMAGVPIHARNPQQILVANGILFQCANLGSLAGPPAVAAAVTALGGWNGGRWLIPAIAMLGVLAAVALRGVERRIADADSVTGAGFAGADAGASQ
ncbi:CynX/NimT family MFS transporter [Aromatoleum buckelii]|uniref:MFS transporter n=1 Tax=Aromatoleum buckelii TaxID=200254 RepID=A0ABX1N641_9RHOO|nr:MFS transporter [Aromatoleum buckelii]MCK0509995.1 MFS transporter [Aromatoleum buckelii]